MASVLSKILHRPPGKGWIILAGGPLPEGHVLRTLALINRAGTVIALVPRMDNYSSVETMLSPWLDRTGWPGKVVVCESETNLEESISEASLILLLNHSEPEQYREAVSRTDAGEFILENLEDGAVILAEGSAAEAMGDMVDAATSSGEGRQSPGLGWIPGTVIQAHFIKERNASILKKRKNLLRIGIPAETALALGPDDQREIWGDIFPTITFGSGWAHGE